MKKVKYVEPKDYFTKDMLKGEKKSTPKKKPSKKSK